MSPTCSAMIVRAASLARRRELRDRRLDQQAGLGELLVRRLAESQHQRQGAEYRLVIDLGNEGAAVGSPSDAQKTDFFERAIGLPDRHAARLELARHLAFGR